MTHQGVSPIPREARPYQGNRAGVISRFTGSLIDGVLVTFLVLIAYLSANVMVFMLDPRSFRVLDTSVAFLLGAGIVLAIVYLTTSWALTGRSYGCHVMGLRVVDRRQRKPAAAPRASQGDVLRAVPHRPAVVCGQQQPAARCRTSCSARPSSTTGGQDRSAWRPDVQREQQRASDQSTDLTTGSR